MRVNHLAGLAAVLHLSLAGVVWAGQTIGSNLPDSPALFACLLNEEVETRSAAIHNCFGRDPIQQIMDACLKDPSHRSEWDDVACVQTANNALEAVMNAGLAHIKAVIRANDRKADEAWQNRAIAQLDQSQQAWVAFNAAEIDLYATLVGAGGVGLVRILTDRDQEQLLERISFLARHLAEY